MDKRKREGEDNYGESESISMLYYVRENFDVRGNLYNAGSKARVDLENIFESREMIPININFSVENKRVHSGKIKKWYYHRYLSRKWNETFVTSNIRAGDVVVIQFPMINHTMYFAGIMRKMRQRKIQIVLFLHDLECLRLMEATKGLACKYRMNKEEVSILKNAAVIVVHNSKMKILLNGKYGIPEEKMVELEVFDYLIDEKKADNTGEGIEDKSCVFAGNLSREKAGFLYRLPENLRFHLYGAGYEDMKKDNVVYHGKCLPEQLPAVIRGMFGIVWDGESAESCKGVYGKYLKYNNPHKASLYLASGIPIIIWEQAALADFVEKYQVGIAVGSLYDIKDKLDHLSEEKYAEMKANAKELGSKLRMGWFTIQAVENSMKRLSDRV